MPQTAPPQGNAAVFTRRINAIEAQIRALQNQQTSYLAVGASIYVLDSNGNAVFILGDISSAPMGINTGSPSTVSTSLTGRGAASHKTGSWVQI